jgi:kynurenine formamidase
MWPTPVLPIITQPVEKSRETVISRRVEFVFAPLPIVGSDGSPTWVLARPVTA